MGSKGCYVIKRYFSFTKAKTHGPMSGVVKDRVLLVNEEQW